MSHNDKPDLNLLATKIDELYEQRQRMLFGWKPNEPLENHPDYDKMDNSLTELFQLFDRINVNEDFTLSKDKSKYYYHRGRACNTHSKYNTEAETFLSKAIKLNPSFVDAWNEMAECFSNQNNHEEAKRCFNGALSQKRNKVSLRNLSILARSDSTQSKDNDEKRRLNALGIKLAEEAVKLDTKDGTSWTILGNAYLSTGILFSCNLTILNKALSAYENAAKDPKIEYNYDHFVNWASACLLKQEFEKTLTIYGKVLKVDAKVLEIEMKMTSLINHLDNAQELVNQKGKLKPKKLTQMIEKLNKKQLGNWKIEHLVAIKDLQIGENNGKIIVGKVVCAVQNDDDIPFTFCLMDDLQTCYCVSVFNLAPGKGVLIGDTVAVPEPLVKHVHFQFDKKTYNFKLIQVYNPLKLVINGKLKDFRFEAGIQAVSSH